MQSIADYFGLFDGIFGSEGGVNIAGRQEADVLCATFGEGGFYYLGEAAIDEAVWLRSHILRPSVERDTSEADDLRH